MPVFVDPQSGKRYNNVPEADQERAQKTYGLVPVDQYEAEQRSGDLTSQVQTAGEEAVRRVASGSAAAARGLLGDEGTDAGLVSETTGRPGFTGADIVPSVFSDEAKERRAVNPGSAAIGGAAPIIASGLLAPATGGASLAATVGLDAADAAAQEAVDADIEQRGINGENVLRNAALNTLFSGAGAAIPLAAKGVLKAANAGEDLVRTAAKGALKKAEEYGGTRISKRMGEVVDAADEALDGVKAPKLASNPNSQRAAMEAFSSKFEKAYPQYAENFKDLQVGSAAGRYEALQNLRSILSPGEDFLTKEVDDVLQREDLWGKKMVDFQRDMEAVKATKPSAGADRSLFGTYADSLRKIPGKKFSTAADELEQLVGMQALEPIVGSIAGSVSKKAAGHVARAASGAVGGVFGGWPGYILGQGVGEILAPAAERVAAHAEPAIASGLVKSAQALKQFAENDQKLTARLMVNPEAAGKFGRVVGDIPTPFQRFQGVDEHPQQAYDRWTSTLDNFKNDPESLINSLHDDFGAVAEQSPFLHRQVSSQALKIASFLQDKRPPPRGVSVARPKGTPPSPLEMRQFALYATAAVDPASVMADARAGKLRQEQVATLKQLWPTEYNGLRNAVVDELGNGTSTTATRQRMNLLFGFGGSIDPALGPKVSQQVAAARQARADESKSASGGSITAKIPPSISSTAPAGEQALQLGNQMTF